MKRLILILLASALMLVSCSVLDEIAVTGNGSKTELSRINEGTLYVVSKSSSTYHLSDCYIAKRIKEENRFEVYELDFLIKRGFSPCKRCINE